MVKIASSPVSDTGLMVKSRRFVCLFECCAFNFSRFMLSNFPLAAILLAQSLLGDYDVNALLNKHCGQAK